jgi:2-polyprenyl-3-methyl-5-hydroxy-6-metoxy-1,4-benzoquinol methylase
MNLRDLRRRAETLVRRTWMKYALRGVSQADAHRRLDLAYKVRDPWKMDSPQEQFRFAETNRIVHRALIAPAERAGSLLEIGTGEGHQTEHLARLCDRLSGIDVSPTAIARARQRVPAATLYAGDLHDQAWAGERGRYDVVTAFEVLYYLKDIPKMLTAMSRLGRACAVSYFAPSAKVVEAPLDAMPIAGRDSFRHGDVEWRIAWWRNA